MAHELFEDVVEPSVSVGTHSWYSLPLSLATHVVLVGALLIVPFVGSYVFPTPQTVLAFATPPATPPPPPVTVMVEPVAMPVSAEVIQPDAAPLTAPDGLRDEPESMPVRATPPTSLTSVRTGGTDTLRPLTPPTTLEAPAPSPQPPIRVGGAIGEPRKLHHVDPVYPVIARAARRGGLVIIEATIARDGRVGDVRVLRADPMFERAAIEAVRQWRYTPPTLNGTPIDVIMTITVRFGME